MAPNVCKDLFLEAITKEGVHILSGRKHLHKELPKNFSPKFGKMTKNLSHTQKFACSYTYMNHLTTDKAKPTHTKPKNGK